MDANSKKKSNRHPRQDEDIEYSTELVYQQVKITISYHDHSLSSLLKVAF